eukprot:EC692160.1.p1 GENE.EC692160.1~~EC692160.1.p1  ORF type:complete len:140 (+),score=38.28 EC692160.1:108-527(+)
MVKALYRPKNLKANKKRSKKFFRHQSDRFKCVPESWRRPKGIDGCVRRKFRGEIPMPSCGYGSAKKTRHMHQDGLYRFRVFNPKDLDVLLMNNRTYAAVIASNVSAKNRRAIVERALQLDIKVTNANARLKEEENETAE